MSQKADPPIPERTRHPFVTYDMIFQIPQAIQQTLDNNREKIRTISTKIKNKHRFYFTGCGTAYFAATLGAHFLSLGEDAEIQSISVPALELINYDYPADQGSVTIGISHSGITKTTVDALHHAKAKGSFPIGITHFKDRPISEAVHETLIVGNSPDKSRCHTKCYVAGATACALIAIDLLKGSTKAPSKRMLEIEKGLKELPRMTEHALKTADDICERLAGKHSTKNRFYFAGTGPNVPNTHEAALKIMETSYLPAQGFETEQLLHGPWISLDENSVVVALAPSNSGHGRHVDLVKAARTVGASVISIVDQEDEELRSISDDTIELPSVDEYLSPFVNIIPLYLLAYYSSVKRGLNPDDLRYPTPKYWQGRNIIFPPGTH
jgi:glucosamine--fructose-6-phosphate aminotransferase (isomerizing)